MTVALGTHDAASTWGELFALSRSETGERALLDRLVDLWRDLHGARGVALYLDHDGALRRERVAGDGRFPDRVAAAAPAPPGTVAVHLPGGLLLVEGGAAPRDALLADPVSVLLAGAVRRCQLERRLKEKHFQANYRGVELEALYDVGLAIASTLDLERLSEEILLRAASLLDARLGALFLLEGERYRLRHTFGGESLAELTPAAVEALFADPESAPAGLLPGARHLLAVAIEIDGRPRGAILVGDKESRSGVGPFPERDRRTLGLFANQAAIALENARLHLEALDKERLEREMELAADIQRQLLPARLPELPGYDLAGWNRPARQVGGDYYRLERPAPERLQLALGDVSGKGIPAALLVSTLHSALTLLGDRAELGPELLARLNRHVYDSSAANKFITLFVGELEPASGALTYVNAGHNPGLLLRADGTVERLEASGPPAGLLPGAVWTTRTARIGAGDLVCLFSDGITEACSPEDEEFGDDRLIDILRRQGDASLDEMIAAVDHAVRAFVGDQPQGDDQTLLLLRRHAGQGAW